MQYSEIVCHVFKIFLELRINATWWYFWHVYFMIAMSVKMSKQKLFAHMYFMPSSTGTTSQSWRSSSPSPKSWSPYPRPYIRGPCKQDALCTCEGFILIYCTAFRCLKILLRVGRARRGEGEVAFPEGPFLFLDISNLSTAAEGDRARFMHWTNFGIKRWWTSQTWTAEKLLPCSGTSDHLTTPKGPHQTFALIWWSRTQTRRQPSQWCTSVSPPFASCATSSYQDQVIAEKPTLSFAHKKIPNYHHKNASSVYSDCFRDNFKRHFCNVLLLLLRAPRTQSVRCYRQRRQPLHRVPDQCGDRRGPSQHCRPLPPRMVLEHRLGNNHAHNFKKVKHQCSCVTLYLNVLFW